MCLSPAIATSHPVLNLSLPDAFLPNLMRRTGHDHQFATLVELDHFHAHHLNDRWSASAINAKLQPSSRCSTRDPLPRASTGRTWGSATASTHSPWHQTDAAAGVQVHVSDVSGADELVVHEHPGALSLVGLVGHLSLRHLNRGVAGRISNLNLEQWSVAATRRPGMKRMRLPASGFMSATSAVLTSWSFTNTTRGLGFGWPFRQVRPESSASVWPVLSAISTTRSVRLGHLQGRASSGCDCRLQVHVRDVSGAGRLVFTTLGAMGLVAFSAISFWDI